MHFIDTATSNRRSPGQIRLHGPDGFEGMRRAGRLTAKALDILVDEVRPGVSTERLDRLVHDFARDHGAYPAPLQYRGYPKSICTSINAVVCHGIPNARPLAEGDILNIDVTLVLDGWHGDSSRMYCVGKVKPFGERLIRVTHEAMMRGIAAVKPGATTKDIGAAIQSHAEAERCSVVEDFCGHGVGRLFHDEPNILHYAHSRQRKKKWRYGEDNAGQRADADIKLLPGMIFTIEPMINLGGPEVAVVDFVKKGGRKEPDGWTAVTADGKLSAQFEHSVGVTETGSEVFTFSPKGLHQPPYAASAAA